MSGDYDQLNDAAPKQDKLIFKVLHARLANEQAFFWQRFTAFSALHAGLFVVLVSNNSAATTIIAFIGFTLALAWVLIQGASLHYVDRQKPLYYNYCDRCKIPKPPEHRLFKKPLSSTNIGFAVSIIVLIFWMFFLCNVLSHSIGWTRMDGKDAYTADSRGVRQMKYE